MPPPPPPVPDDDDRHRREQAILRTQRKATQKNKSAAQIETDRKRKEHAQRVLKEQNLKRQQQSDPKKPRPPPPSKASDQDGGSSVFASLFSKRAEGFLIDLNFRNAPPRPPVGPCFVGLGLEGELNDKWTRYKPFNAVEANYTWKLHSEPDLGVPLAPSAMDWEGCYTDPAKASKQTVFAEDDGADSTAMDGTKAGFPPPLHPDDASLIHWTGSMGDTAAEELQVRRDRARAAARLQDKNGGKKLSPTTAATTTSRNKAIGLAKNKSGFQSRVLDEKNQFWMKNTTYLTNDQSRSVHAFTSLAQTKAKNVDDIAKLLGENTKKLSAKSAIEAAFDAARPSPTTRSHPTKRNLEAVYDLPFLPDVSTWGHTYTHVVLDSPPKETPRRPTPAKDQLEHAFIADVEKVAQNTRMVCNLLVPDDVAASSSSEPTTYDVAQEYDLAVLPLKEEGSPHVNFLLLFDPENGMVTYHPILSRVLLSNGRPAGRHAVGSIIAKRALNAEHMTDMELRIAEVDADCAKKHGLLTENGTTASPSNRGTQIMEDSDSDRGF